MIARRQFLARGVGLAAMPLVVGCHPADRVWRVGYLLPTNPGDIGYASFVEGLAQRGYVVGKNVEMVPRFANREIGRLDALAAELVAAKVDLIVAGAPVSIRAAQKATTTIPIVMAFSGDDPVKAGFVQSLGRPGGHVTGVTALSRDLVSKWLELLFEVAPGMTRVAVLMNPSRLEHAEAIKVARAALPAGVQLQVVEGRSPEQYPAAFAEMTREGAGGLMIVADALFTNDVSVIADLAKRHRLPTVYQWSEFVQAGGLMSYGPDHHDLAMLALDYAVRIMKGANPSELPVEQPKRFELALNLKTAAILGLTIADSLRLRAGPDHVVSN